MNFGTITLNQSMKTEQNCYMDTDSFVVNIETEDFYEDIAGNVERWFDTSLTMMKTIKGLF